MPIPRLLTFALLTLWLVAAGTAVHGGGPATPAIDRAVHERLPLFTHSDNCLACHNNLLSAGGEDVSIGAAWRATMMANSARDPYWQAAVRRETLDHPAHAAAIEDECAACHMPMAQKIAHAAGRQGAVFANLPIGRARPETLHRLAADGVSCTVCHQIGPDKLGTADSFNGNFTLLPTPADGARLIFGRNTIDAGRKTIMRSVTGFVQAEAPHIQQSELCASCHTLITQALGPDGEVVGTLPEQMNYQEWQHSAFYDEKRSCQSCHMPTVAGPVRTSSVLGEERDTMARHVFVGGNAFMLRMFNRYRTELGVAALPSELDATAAATVRQLQQDTAALRVSVAEVSTGSLRFTVDVRNLTGHKFPTGYPSRRTWLHVIVRDAGDAVVFESGGVNADGSIEGNDSDGDARRFEPHYTAITRPDQVQIYEPILGDLAGVPTTGLLTATQYLKDNRLLPRGFDKTTAASEIAVHGEASLDADFAGGSDRITYAVGVPSSSSYRVEVELRYQVIGYGWARNLQRYDAPEPQRFTEYYRSMAAASSLSVAAAATEWPQAR
jgi:hypothetical protein